MTVYPFAIDSDQNIIRIDDNLTEVGGESINQLRDAVFAIEKELGIDPSGSAGSLASRLNVSLNPDGTIKASALTSVGLATLPIVDNQVASNAGIKEFKLSLDFTTSNLHTLITANAALLASLTSFANITFSDLSLHIAGANFLSDAVTSARHVLSHIDVNSVPSDTRDPSFIWMGLKDKTGALRTATQAAQALQQINDDLVSHETSVLDAHVATAISVDTSEFTEIPVLATTAQKVFDYLDDAEVLNMGQHRATQHANAIPRVSRSQSPILPDGYRENVIPTTVVFTYLTNPPNTGPVDDLSTGDDLIKFTPSNGNFVFDAQFSQVRVGDIIRVNYGNGIEALFPVESFRYIPNTEWIIRINGVNLFESTDGYASARIDRPSFDSNTVGVLAVASANASSEGDPGSFTNILQSVIVGNPRAATAYGLGFDPGQLNSTHFNLYLEMYPTGNPVDHIISLPGIDVTGNLGTTPGKYDLDSVVESINNNFRAIGFNYRFIAFAHNGEVGIMLADNINNVSFAIVNGSNSTGTLLTSIYTDNVIGGNSLDDFDALGFGSLGADLASPAFQATWTDSTAAQIPTKIIVPLKNRNYIVNGQRRDTFAPTYLANADGYWDGYISARTPVGLFTVEVTYTINLDLAAAKLKPGKTIVVQPAVAFSDGLYSDVDYGRFIIKDVVFVAPCPPLAGHTEITVINGIHATGSGFGFSSLAGLPVRIYFSEDSVGFNTEEIIDQVPTPVEYHRLHEIYVNDHGVTFSHERARLPRQAEDPNKLSTDNLHINAVSPKLRGYRNDGPLTFNKFIRFYVLSYNSTSGEFDGYLGQIAGTNSILRTGPVITGRKNIATRFYDETNIDYIDLTFEELAATPGVSIISTATPRYVDIEVFPSLELDNELFLLATCEINWSPAAGQFIVQNVRDARQFGSIDETNFTDSAMDFISAADRYLHTNGIIRGFDLDSISSVPDSGEIFFKGGVALVNGTIVTANNMSVTIPRIYSAGAILPQTVTWGICVNENNNLIPIPVSVSKLQNFVTADGISNYYIPSVTFLELVTVRKDLTVIALASVTIGSLTVNSVTDVRRFVTSENYGNNLTITPSDIPGTFHTFDAAIEWLQRLDSTKSIVRISGEFDVDSTIDLSGFDNQVVFEGDGAILNVQVPQGIIIGSNVTLKNINFTYVPNTDIFVDGDKINSGNGCIFAAPGSIISDFYIEGCTFSASLPIQQRPPFINIVLKRGSGIRRSAIRDNEFTDGNNTSSQAAVAIVNNNNGSGGDPPAFINGLRIENNRTDSQQGIYITSLSDGANQDASGLVTFDTVISGNACGVIGFCNSAALITSAVNAINCLVVENNRCRLIGTIDGSGVSLIDGYNFSYGTGNTIIRANTAGWILIALNESDANDQILSSTMIVNNVLESQNPTFLDPYIKSGGAAFDIAIFVVGIIQVDEQMHVTITGNALKYGFHPGLFGYTQAGIAVGCSATVTNNIVRCLSPSAIGILAAQGGPLSLTVVRRHIIQGNQIHRLGVAIDRYIEIVQTTVNDRGLVVDNLFDSSTVSNGGSTQTIEAPDTGYVIERNINQIQTQNVSPNAGTWSLGGQNVILGPTGSSSTITVQGDTTHYNYADNPNSEIAVLNIPLLTIVPYGVTIVDVTVFANSSSNSPSQKTVTVQLQGSFSSDQIGPISVTTTIGIPHVLTPAGTPVVIDDGNGAPYLQIFFLATHTSSFQLTLENVYIRYKW